MEKFDVVARPSHYAEGRKYEPKDVIRDWGLNFNLGSAVKYISRAGRKDDILQDLKKAKQFIQFEIDAIEEEQRIQIEENYDLIIDALQSRQIIDEDLVHHVEKEENEHLSILGFIELNELLALLGFDKEINNVGMGYLRPFHIEYDPELKIITFKNVKKII